MRFRLDLETIPLWFLERMVDDHSNRYIGAI